MKKIVIETTVGRETMIINTALITFLGQLNDGGVAIQFIGGGNLSIFPGLDIVDVYSLLFYDGDYLQIDNVTSEEMRKISDVPGVGTPVE